MTAEALKNLLRRHGKEIAEEAESEEAQTASEGGSGHKATSDRTSASGHKNKA